MMLENFFIGVLDVSLQTSLLLVLLFLLDGVLSKRISAQAKCFIWMIFSVRLLIPATFSFALPQGGGAPVQAAANVPLPSAVPAGTEAVAVTPPPTGTETLFQAPVERLYEHISVLEIVALVWLVVAAGFLAAHVAVYLFHVGFLRKRGEAVTDGALLSLLEQVREELHVKRSIRVLVCDKVDTPMILGLFHTYLILPHLNVAPEQLAFILRHEMAHCKRHDLYVKCLLLLARSVHWFNPLVHIMAKKAALDLENACDDTVLTGKDRVYRREYGHVLLDVLSKKKRVLPLSTQFGGNTKELFKRFRNIAGAAPKRKGIVLVCCVLAGTVLLTSSVNPASAQTLSPGVLSLLKATDATPEELEAKKALLAQCLEGSMFEEYRSFRDLPLAAEDYRRCEEAERNYRRLLLQGPGGTVRECGANPSFLAVDSSADSAITGGLFCCQDDGQRDDGEIKLIWLDFADPDAMQVVELGYWAPKGWKKYMDSSVQFISERRENARIIAETFDIDLSQYRFADSEFAPPVLETRAFSIRFSIQRQLAHMGRYALENMAYRKTFTVYIRKDNAAGVLLNSNDSGLYAHFFQIPPQEERNYMKAGGEPYPITENRCAVNEGEALRHSKEE